MDVVADVLALLEEWGVEVRLATVDGRGGQTLPADTTDLAGLRLRVEHSSAV